MATTTTHQYHHLLFALSLCFMLLISSSSNTETESPETHHLVQLSSLLPPSVCHSSPQGANKRGSLRVIHKHGPCSQLIIQGKTKPPTAQEILSQDQSRVNSIQSRINSINSGKQQHVKDSKVSIPAKSGSTLGSGNYIVTVGLGTPKKDLSLIFDTGSSLTWTQCQPCVRSCYSQQEPIFAPSSSTSYSNITCNSPTCSQLNSATGTTPSCSSSTCIYGIQYGDQSFSVGFFGKDKLTLTNSPNDVIDGYLFGCGQNNQGLFGGSAGLLGLGRDKLSLVSQAAQKYGQVFSYCLPSRSSFAGSLTLGSTGISKSVQYTPLTGQDSFYNIDMKAISVGGKLLSISSTVFSTAGTIIDSGTVITRLPPEAYTALRTEFRSRMTKYPLTKAVSILDTCYDLSNYTTVSIPKLSFVFGGNVNVDISFTGILYGVRASQICLAFAGNGDASDTGIFGNVQQKTLLVVYDVAGGKLGFSPAGCS